MRAIYMAVVIGVGLGAGACRADREPFEAGATLETPPEVEQAPLADTVSAPPGSIGTGVTGAGSPMDTLRPGGDTARLGGDTMPRN